MKPNLTQLPLSLLAFFLPVCSRFFLLVCSQFSCLLTRDIKISFGLVNKFLLAYLQFQRNAHLLFFLFVCSQFLCCLLTLPLPARSQSSCSSARSSVANVLTIFCLPTHNFLTYLLAVCLSAHLYYSSFSPLPP